jgi:hypothetical protein
MWARPSGERVLLSPDRRSESLITAIYQFDRTERVRFDWVATEVRVEVRAGPVDVELSAGRGWRIPGPRPLWFTRFVEDPVAQLTMGVRTYGVSPTGVREWYQAEVWRPVVEARARLDRVDLGAWGRIDPPLGVGFTDPPERASIVTVRPVLDDPSGDLDRLLPTRT